VTTILIVALGRSTQSEKLMSNIEDISPKDSPALEESRRYVTGRMLSLASSQDGMLVFAGSLSSNVWVSENGGVSWDQIVWPQPPAGQFGVPGSMGGFCVTDIVVSPDFAQWRGERTPRFLADLTGKGRADILGFGETGVWTALGNGDGTFQPPQVVLADFGYEAGGWRAEKHPRFLADLTGNGMADIVAFGDAGVYVALGNGDGTFHAPKLVIPDFGYEAGGWRVEKHPRFLADVTGDGRADIVAFGDAGVYVALSNGDGTFTFKPHPVLRHFGYEAGGWRVEKHPRLLAGLTGNGRADIVGFGDAGVYVALSNGDGTFTYHPHPVVRDFGYEAGGWRVEKHPRLLADLTGKGRADIVGFGDAGVYVALNNADGTFAYHPRPVVHDFGYEAGGWRTEKHPRFLADVTGNGRADIVGFGDAGVYIALSNGDGTFVHHPRPVIHDFGYEAVGWRVEKHPRFLADLTGKGCADIVGFGDAGVRVALSNGRTFQASQFVLGNFGSEITVLAIVRSDRESNDRGIWRSTDRGSTWSLVYQFPELFDYTQQPAGQLVWAPGSGNLVYAAGYTGLAVSRDGGATFQTVPLGTGGLTPVNHVAVAAVLSGILTPPVVYALGASRMFVSLDGGVVWTEDQGLVPQRLGAEVGLSISQAPSVLVVSPRSAFEVFAVTDANPPSDQTHELWRGDYSQFAATLQSTWKPVPIPELGQQFSGNVFIAATQPGRGDLLFYCPQQSKTFVGPLDPASASDWQPLDMPQIVHIDLHGIFLSSDFAATLVNGNYQATAGTVWMISDGGIHRSTDGGKTFHAAQNVNTLSCVNIAGVALELEGPAISLNTGDNDGFYSMNGGENWQLQDYGGGDDDCSFADPLRPRSMLLFTPRWDTNGAPVAASLGQTVAIYETVPGQLPNAMANTNMRRVVPGPPLRPGTTTWNASSGYGLLGFRPIVLNLPGDDPAAAGDYIFIRFDPAPAVLLRTPRLLEVHDRLEWESPGEWRVEKHPRFLADLTGQGREDIIGFGDQGVWTALSNGDGTFQEARLVIADFGYEAGGWRVEKHPRFLADVTGDGRADIVGFGNDGVYIAFGNGDGTFTYQPVPVIPDFGYDAGGWRVEKNPRLLGDIRGNGRADIVGFGNDGVYIAFSNGDGTFSYQQQPVIPDFGYDAGGWRVEKNPRLLGDIKGNGRADIVGFGNDGVYIAFSNGDGTFSYQPVPVIPDFGYDAGGWRVEKHPRFLADIIGNGRADIVGFGDDGVYAALSKDNGTFQPILYVVSNFGYKLQNLFSQEGPALPSVAAGIVQASGGHTGTVFYVAGDGASRLWKWTEGMADWQLLVPGGGANQARRFFVNPYNPSLLYLMDVRNVLRSDDGGIRWQIDANLEEQLTCGHRIPIDRDDDRSGQGDRLDAVLTDMKFDPFNPERRFAVGLAGAFMTNDGVNWVRLLDTTALRGRPASCYFDWISNPSIPALYVAFAGRSLVRISPL
jgi:hypothetical protein